MTAPNFRKIAEELADEAVWEGDEFRDAIESALRRVWNQALGEVESCINAKTGNAYTDVQEKLYLYPLLYEIEAMKVGQK